MYQHRDWQGSLLDFPVNKVVCVGSNYADHIKEMGSATSAEPVVFIKPETALCDIRQPVAIPKEFGSVHHEVELAVLIGTPLKQANEDRVARAIAGYGVALDLTLRELQAAAGLAVTATGTSFSDSSRRRAVTTMSSTLEACSVGAGACWAKAGAAHSGAAMKTLVISARRNCPVVRILVSSPRAVVWSPLICVGETVIRERPRCQHHSFLHE